jgi:hypothetical protein
MSIVRTAILVMVAGVLALPACGNDNPQTVKKKVYALEQVKVSE